MARSWTATSTGCPPSRTWWTGTTARATRRRGRRRTSRASRGGRGSSCASAVVSVQGGNVHELVVAAPKTAAAVAAQQAEASRHGVEHFGDANGTPLVTGSATPAVAGQAVQPGTGSDNGNALLTVTSTAS